MEAVNDVDGRTERGNNAYEQIRAAYAWSVLAERVAASYRTLTG